jgi:hypothetical protein
MYINIYPHLPGVDIHSEKDHEHLIHLSTLHQHRIFKYICIGYHVSSEVISVLSLEVYDIINVTSERSQRGTFTISF